MLNYKYAQLQIYFKLYVHIEQIESNVNFFHLDLYKLISEDKHLCRCLIVILNVRRRLINETMKQSPGKEIRVSVIEGFIPNSI